MNDTIKTIFGLIGALALFLYGMNSMSDALQKTAGGKMKKILSFLTKNPIMGALAGTLVTAVLQSSSATTVIAIGFVSAGLMTLPQAISVIFGANIGTTIIVPVISMHAGTKHIRIAGLPAFFKSATFNDKPALVRIITNAICRKSAEMLKIDLSMRLST